MNNNRFDYLRNKWPIIQYNGWGDALPDTVKSVPIIKRKKEVQLKYITHETSSIDVNVLIKELRELYKIYPQFEKIKIQSASTDEFVYKVIGFIDETEGEFKLRLENEKEKMELYAFLKEEHEIAVEEEEKFQLEMLKEKYEKV